MNSTNKQSIHIESLKILHWRRGQKERLRRRDDKRNLTEQTEENREISEISTE